MKFLSAQTFVDAQCFLQRMRWFRLLMGPFLLLLMLTESLAGSKEKPSSPLSEDVLEWSSRPLLRWSLSDVVTMAVDQAPQIEIDRMEAVAARGRLIASYDILTPQFTIEGRYAERNRLLNQFQSETLGQIRARDSANLQSALDTGLSDPGIDEGLEAEIAAQESTDIFDLSGPLGFGPLNYFENVRNSRTSISKLFPWGTQLSIDAVELEFEDTFTSDTTLTGIPLSPIFPRQQEFQVGLNLLQPLWRDFGPDAALASIRIRRAEFKVADATFLGNVDAYLAGIVQEYMGLAVLGKAVEAHRESVEAAEQLLAQTEDLYEEGLTDIVEVARQRTALASRENSFWRAQASFFTNQNELLGMVLPEYNAEQVAVRVKPVTPMELELPEVMEPAVHVSEAMERSGSVPRIAAAIANIQQAEAEKDFLLNEAKPRLDLTASIGYRGLGRDMGGAFNELISGDHPEWLVGISFSIPLGGALSTGRSTEAEAGVVAAREALKRARLEVSLRIENALQECLLAHVRIVKAKEMIADATEAVRVETLKLETGRTLAHQVQELQSELLFAQLRRLEAEFAFQEALINLYLAKGTIMEELGVEVEPVSGVTRRETVSEEEPVILRPLEIIKSP